MSDFTDAIERELGDLHVAPGAAACCPECLETYDIGERDARGRFRSVDDKQAELYEVESAHFSWRPCECCGSTFGGDRHEAHGIENGEVIHLDICTDCLLYLANGDEPEEWFPSPHAAREAGW